MAVAAGWNHQYRVKLGLSAAAVHGDLRPSKAFVLHFGEALQHELSHTGFGYDGLSWTTATSFFEGTPTTMSDRSFDTPEMVVREILRAFDQGKAVAYPVGRAYGSPPGCPGCCPAASLCGSRQWRRKDGLGVTEDRFAARCGQWRTRTLHAGQDPHRDGHQQTC